MGRSELYGNPWGMLPSRGKASPLLSHTVLNCKFPEIMEFTIFSQKLLEQGWSETYSDL